MIYQRRIRASFNSRCRLSTVKGLVVSRGPIPDCLFAKLEMTTPGLVGQPVGDEQKDVAALAAVQHDAPYAYRRM